MKFLILFVVFVGLAESCWAQSSAEPSLEVTMKWLTDNLPNARSDSFEVDVRIDKNGKPDKKHPARSQTSSWVVTGAKANGCVLTISKRLTVDQSEYQIFSMDDIPLDRTEVKLTTQVRINGIPTVETETFTPPSTTVISFSAGPTEIREKTLRHWTDNTSPDQSTNETTSGASFEIDDAEFAGRLFKALSHAAQLCAVRPKIAEPF